MITLDQISLDRIKLLHPKIKDEVLTLFTQAQSEITPTIRIVQGLRTFAEQDALFAKVPKVTNSRGGQSYHNYGLAIDFALLSDGKISWKVDDDWKKVVNVFKGSGYVWGGDWFKFKDYPHLEKTFGYNWRALQAKHKNKEFIEGTEYVIID